MDSNDACAAFAALSQPSRLEAFRLLVRRAPDPVGAGEIAARLGVRPNTLSSHLSVLHAAGLVTRTRAGRHIRYGLSTDGLSDLLGYLLEDCCGAGRGASRDIIREIRDGCC